MYISVVVNKSSESLDKSFTYNVPFSLEDKAEPYKRVIVPFGRGNKPITGIILEVFKGKPDFNFKLKDCLSIVDEKPFITEDEADIARYISSTTGANFVDSLKLFFPPVAYESIICGFRKIKDFDDKGAFKSEFISEDEFNNYNLDENFLIENGFIKRFYKLKNEPKKKTVDVLRATGKIEELTIRQEEIFDEIKKCDYTRKELKNITKVSDSVINALISKGVVKLVKVEQKDELVIEDNYKKLNLNSDQQFVFDNILNEFKGNKKNKFLLRGITGSGKTEIYLQLVEEVLKEGKNAIILVPEIGLTPQTVRRFKGRFNEDIAIIHSRLNKTERFMEWMKIKNQEVRIVVGARSAVFSPLRNIGIIIIDEEHDNSYISGKSPKYKTVDVASYRVSKDRGILLLGSATPSIETYYKTKNGEYGLYELNRRANNKKMPPIEVVNMCDELNEGNTSIFSLRLYEAILDNLKKGEQTMLFLNKRGYSGFISCRSCGESIKCEECDVSMTYHKKENLLICHYCGRTKKLPNTCPVCGSKKIKDFGIGTEQVEEITKKTFPEARVLRMDRDTTTKKDSHLEIYNKMNNGDIDILIGTQMIAKGLDFKNVTLVGVLAADMMLKIPDYRSPEWTYSTIRQVSGRSGRGDKDGRVILQTYEPEHYAIKCAKDSSFDEFFRKEIAIRREFKYPPFYNILLLRSEGEDNSKAYNKLKFIYDNLILTLGKTDKDIIILHPNPSPISKINKLYRWQFMIKVKPEDREFIIKILDKFRGDIIVDIDPVNMM